MVGARIALACTVFVLSACGQQGSAGPGSSASGVQGPARCALRQLRFTRGPSAAATSNQVATISVANISGSSCYLGGYPGVELLDPAGRHLEDAQRSTDSFFGSYAPPHRVDIPPGGTTSFDLTWGSNDPCGGTAGEHGAQLKVTPPGDYDASTIAAQVLVCPHSLVVHPVGSPTPSG